MKTHHSLCIVISHVDITALLFDELTQNTHVLSSGALVERTRAHEPLPLLDTLRTVLAHTLCGRVRTALIVMPDEYLYSFTERHTDNLAHSSTSAAERVARMIPYPVEKLVWAEHSRTIPNAGVSFIVMRNDLALTIKEILHESAGVQDIHVVSATTAVWNTAVHRSSQHGIVVCADRYSIDIGLFAVNEPHPLMTLAVPTPGALTDIPNEINTMVSHTLRYAQEYYAFTPSTITHKLSHDISWTYDTDHASDIQTVAWLPPVQSAPQDTTDPWHAACASLLSPARVAAVAGITMYVERVFGHGNRVYLQTIRTILTDRARMCAVRARSLMEDRRRTLSALSAAAVCCSALGLFVWTITTYL